MSLLTKQKKWIDTQKVMAVAYDTPINGYNTNTTINLRLWKAMPFSVLAFCSCFLICRNLTSLLSTEVIMYQL